jgi:cytochrome oxidase assembly protein ShyY1
MFATIVVIIVGVSLGQWQLRRAAYKEAIEARLRVRGQEAPVVLGTAQVDPDKLEYRRAVVSGEFIRNWPIYLENRPHDGVAGFYLFMPLKIAGTNLHVLIARGWVPRDPSDRTKLPDITTPVGMMTVEGIIKRDPARIMQLGQANAIRPNAILQNLEVSEFASASGMTIQPILIEQTNDTHDGLVRSWPRPSSGIETHYGYAVQWFGLAATAFIFFVVTGFRRGSKHKREK